MTKTTAKQKFAFNKAPPTNFTKPVDIVLFSGEIAEIEFSFIYRTRAQFAALVDQNIADATTQADALAKEEKKKPGKSTIASMYKKMDDMGVAYVLKIADGWDLDDPFCEVSLLKLEDENPGSLAEIGNVYRAAVAEARTKN